MLLAQHDDDQKVGQERHGLKVGSAGRYSRQTDKRRYS